MQWAHANGFPWDSATCSEAAALGRLDVLQWACFNDGPWDKDTFFKGCCRWTSSYSSVGSGKRVPMGGLYLLHGRRCRRIDVLQWARAENCPCDTHTCSQAAQDISPFFGGLELKAVRGTVLRAQMLPRVGTWNYYGGRVVKTVRGIAIRVQRLPGVDTSRLFNGRELMAAAGNLTRVRLLPATATSRCSGGRRQTVASGQPARRAGLQSGDTWKCFNGRGPNGVRGPNRHA